MGLLARTNVQTSPAFGKLQTNKQTLETFGVGVLFLLACKNNILFDL